MASRTISPVRVASANITDSTVFGRALLTAASAAAQRTALGLLDLSGVEMSALAHANSVCAFTKLPTVWRAYMNPKTATAASKWITHDIGGTGGIVQIVTGADVGGREITTGATANSYCQLSSLEGSTYVQPLSAELIGAKWHFECDFKLVTAIDNVTELGIGFNDGALSYGRPLIGVRGHQSTGFFRCFLGVSATGANSTVAVDLNVWHKLRMWSDGTAGTIYFSVDGETAIALTGLASTGVVGPYIRTHNGATAANRGIRNRYAFYTTEGLLT